MKWNIRPGDVIRVRGFGSEEGTNFHIAEVTMRPNEGTVELRVDSKFRDLLTIEEIQARTRDPFTPVKALRVNSRSVLQDDLLYPWNWADGAGCLPQYSINFHNKRSELSSFPYETETVKAGMTPSEFFSNGSTPSGPDYEQHGDMAQWSASKGWYIPVHAGAASPNNRWTFFPILTAQAGTIRRTEMCAYTASGEIAQVEFHFSIYSFPFLLNDSTPPYTAMPSSNEDPGVHQPYFPQAFQTINPATGMKYADEERNLYMPELRDGRIS